MGPGMVPRRGTVPRRGRWVKRGARALASCGSFGWLELGCVCVCVYTRARVLVCVCARACVQACAHVQRPQHPTVIHAGGLVGASAHQSSRPAHAEIRRAFARPPLASRPAESGLRNRDMVAAVEQGLLAFIDRSRDSRTVRHPVSVRAAAPPGALKPIGPLRAGEASNYLQSA